MIRVIVKRNDFPKLPPKCRGAAKRGTLASAERIVQDARGRYSATPGDTKQMQRETVARGVGPTDAVTVAGAPHSIYQDRGTSRGVPATRWFSGAVESEAQRFPGAMAADVRAGLGG